MKVNPNGPADTRIMGVVHTALRRDIGRALAALTHAPHPQGPRQIAIADHVDWLMTFLHAHHRAEDDGLYPLVRRRNPDAGELLDQMDADHGAIATVIDAVHAATVDYRATGFDARSCLIDALTDLNHVLLPHLQREEDEMMPVVAATITQSQWRDWDQAYNIKNKSLTQLGEEGHWLLDSVDAEGYQVIVHQVPAVARLILLKGFAGRYRRAAARRWGPTVATGPVRVGQGKTPRRVSRSGRVEVHVTAPAGAVWCVLSDVTRVGEWSHECREASWLHGATAAASGVRFRGRNKAGLVRWSRVNRIIVADEPRELAWRTIPTWFIPDSTEWRISLTPAGTGTQIVQTFQVLKLPAFFDWLYSRLIPGHRGRQPALGDDLRRLGTVAAAEAGINERQDALPSGPPQQPAAP